jgi:hypothetical protein
MLKKSLVSPAQPRRAETRLSPCGVFASYKPSTLSRIFSDVESTGVGLPFAKIHSRGKRPTRSAVCTSSSLHSLRACPRNGASWRAGAVRVKSPNFFSILRSRGLLSETCGPLKFRRPCIVFPQPLR